MILTHPAGRLLLGEHILYIAVLLFVCFLIRFCLSKSSGLHSGIIAFFITCAFAAPVDEEKGTLNQYINRLPTGLALLLLFLSLHRISMHVTKTAMVVDAGFVIFFIVAIVKREVNPSEQN